MREVSLPGRPDTQYAERRESPLSASEQSDEGGSLEQTRIRGAQNQSLFREVNERIEEIRPPSTFVEFVCECTLEGCSERVDLTQQEYESVRSDSNRFAVRPGHVVPGVELVVERTDRYEVVEKIGAGKVVAVKLDPRRRKRHLQAAPEPPASPEALAVPPQAGLE